MLFLFVAIFFEVFATTAIKYTNGFTNIIPTIICLVGYTISFYFLSLAVKTIPIGICYAIWSGFGIVAISLIGFFAFKQKLDLSAILGIILIIAGVLVINLFSNSSH